MMASKIMAPAPKMPKMLEAAPSPLPNKIFRLCKGSENCPCCISHSSVVHYNSSFIALSSGAGVMATLSLQELLNQLTDEKPKVRKQAVQELGKLGDPAAIPQLVKVQQIDKDKGVKAEAKKALIKFRALEAAANAPPDTPKTALLKKSAHGIWGFRWAS